MLFHVFVDSDVDLDRRFLAEMAAAVGLEDYAGEARQGTWEDAATGARAIADFGQPVLGGEELLPRNRDDWRQLPLRVQCSLDGPHWRVVELGAWLADRLASWPEIRVLLPDDPRDGAPPEEPSTFDRHRLLAAWEAQHYEFEARRDDRVQVDRRRSLALWRALRERAEGQARFPELHWPSPHLLLREREPVLAVIVPPEGPDLAVPMADLAVVRRDAGTGLLPIDELLTAAGGGEDLEVAGARRVRRDDRVQDLLARARLLDPGPFRLLIDGDWYD